MLIDAIEMKTQTRCSNNRQSRVLGMETIFSTSNSLPYSSHTPSYGSFIVFTTNKEEKQTKKTRFEIIDFGLRGKKIYYLLDTEDSGRGKPMDILSR